MACAVRTMVGGLFLVRSAGGSDTEGSSAAADPALVDEALASLNGRFEGLYSTMGRPSIAPEMLLRATLLQAFFRSARSGC